MFVIVRNTFSVFRKLYLYVHVRSLKKTTVGRLPSFQKRPYTRTSMYEHMHECMAQTLAAYRVLAYQPTPSI